METIYVWESATNDDIVNNVLYSPTKESGYESEEE